MKVVVGSLFRSSAHRVPRYINQIRELRDTLTTRGDSLSCVWVEGDSNDNTWDTLHGYLHDDIPGKLVKCDHGEPDLGSVVDPGRLWALSVVGNCTMDNIDEDADVYFFVESDLIWDAETALALIDECIEINAVIAPMIMIYDDWFYDTWAFRKDGVNFTNFLPYHDSLKGNDIVDLDCAGSCLAMPIAAARSNRYSSEEAIAGLCKNLVKSGWRVCVDTRYSIKHP